MSQQTEQTFKYCTDERFNLVLDAVTRISKLPNPDEESIELAKRLSVGESAILSVLIKTATQNKEVEEFTEAELDKVVTASDRYLAILDAIGIPIMVPRNRMNQEQIKALDDSAEHINSLHILINIWRIANVA